MCCDLNRRVKYAVTAAIAARLSTPPTTLPAIAAVRSVEDDADMIVGPFVEVEEAGEEMVKGGVEDAGEEYFGGEVSGGSRRGLLR